MADTKISVLAEHTTPLAPGDLWTVVDVSDTTMAASGTNKKVTQHNKQFQDVADVTDETTVVGHARIIGAKAVAGGVITLIANGARDVTSILHAQATIKPSAGLAEAGPFFIRNNDSWDLYNDGGTNVLTLTCNADGSLEVQRTAGALTYDIVLNAIWI